MILVHALRQLFPNANFERDILLQNDGNGDYIKEWNLPEPQPAPAELEAAWQAWLADTPAREQKRLDTEQAPILAKQWLALNPQTVQLFALSIEELEADIGAHVDALFPLAAVAVRAKEKKLRVAQLVVSRMLIKRELS